MHVRALISSAALVIFLFIIAYSLVLNGDVEHAKNLNTLGGRVVIQYSLAFLCMCLVWWATPREPSFNSLAPLIVVAIISRILLLFVDAYTSNDVSRYLFDGRVALEGLDPYSVPHNAAELVELRNLWMPPTEHAKYTTLYPPFALVLFSFAASSGVEWAELVWNIMTTLASLAVLGVGYLVLAKARRLQHFALLALSPLLILEAGEGAHLDVFSALFVLIAIHLWQSNKFGISGLMLGLGALTKILPILLLLPLLLLNKHWSSRLRFSLSAIFTCGGGYALAMLLGYRPIGSLNVFFEKWRFGSPFFLWAETTFSPFPIFVMIIVLCTVSFSLIAFSLWGKTHSSASSNESDSSDKASRGDIEHAFLAMQLVIATPLLLSPVIFAWYLLPLAVLVALRPSAFIVTWMACLPFTYEALSQFHCCQQWLPASWPIHLIGIVLIVAAITDCLLYRYFHTNKPRNI